MRGKLQGGRTDKRTTRSLRARRVLRLAAADTDQNTAHFRQSGKSNVCCGMHAQNIMPENEGKRGRKLVYGTVRAGGTSAAAQDKWFQCRSGASIRESAEGGRRGRTSSVGQKVLIINPETQLVRLIRWRALCGGGQSVGLARGRK